MYTKGAVLLVCFQCVDTLVFELKHCLSLKKVDS